MIRSIRQRQTFDELVRHGLRVRTATLWCTYLSEPAANPPRVAFSIGRGVGKAVVRNRLRRRLRVLFAAASPAPGTYLIGVQPAGAKHTFESLAGEMTALLEATRAGSR